jgi:hypothetical protein
MDRPRLIRGVRIAWTVGCGVLCVLLVCLGIRSHGTLDSIGWISGWGVNLTSFDGRIELMLNSGKTEFPDSRLGLTYITRPNFVWAWPNYSGWARYGFDTCAGAPGIRFVSFPHWLPALAFAAIAAAPWTHWHFRLQTLLIATTLIAVVLGLAAAYLRLW